MNNKIAGYALSKAFGKKATKFMELCVQTPNPETAVEILLDIYEEPIINAQPHEKCETHHIDKVFVSYNKWENRVYYKGMRNKNRKDEPPAYEPVESYCTLKSWNQGGW